MAWNVAGEFISLKNITVGLKDPSSVVNAAFYSSPSLILTLLYPYLRSILVKTFFVPMFSNIPDIKGSR